MKKRKKYLCLMILLLCMLFTFGCSKTYGLDKENPVSISLWHYYNGVQQQQFDTLVANFNETLGAETGIVVEAYAKGNVNDIAASVLDSMNGKVGAEDIPEIFAAYADTAYEVNKQEYAADIRKYMTEEEISSYMDAYILEGQLGEEQELKLFPIAKSTELFIINKTDWDKFANETGASDASFATWEGIAEVSKAYYEWTDAKTKAPDDGKAFFGRDAMANYIIIGSMQLGKEIFKVQNGEVTYQLDKEIIRKIWDNYYVPYINGYYKSVGKFRSDDAKTGEIVATVGSNTSAAYFPDTVTLEDETSYPITAAVYPAPNFEGSTPTVIQQGAGMIVTKSSETKEYAATVFLKWFTEKEQNIAFSISSGYLPVKKEANDMAVIDEAIKTQNLEFKPLVYDSIKNGVEMTKSYQFYTTKAFEGAQQARKILTDVLQQKAEEDLLKIAEQMEQGISKEKAVNQYDTDENFDLWFNQLTSLLG